MIRINKKNKKAEMGIGTLIIFIAMIFVAGVVAAVFVQTATSLQNKAFATADASKKSISTKVKVMHISADDGSDGTIENFKYEIKPIVGSEDIKLNESFLSIELSNHSVNLIYSNESCNNVTDASGDGYYTDASTGTGTFTVVYLTSANNHYDGYLLRGEMVKLCFSSPRDINEDEVVKIRFMPKYGTPSSTEFITPDVMTTQIVQVYP